MQELVQMEVKRIFLQAEEFENFVNDTAIIATSAVQGTGVNAVVEYLFDV